MRRQRERRWGKKKKTEGEIANESEESGARREKVQMNI
jgi:hypothetical protein